MFHINYRIIQKNPEIQVKSVRKYDACTAADARLVSV